VVVDRDLWERTWALNEEAVASRRVLILIPLDAQPSILGDRKVMSVRIVAHDSPASSDSESVLVLYLWLTISMLVLATVVSR